MTKPLFFGLLLLRERSLAAAGRFGAGELQTEVVRMRIWPGMRVLLETEGGFLCPERGSLGTGVSV